MSFVPATLARVIFAGVLLLPALISAAPAMHAGSTTSTASHPAALPVPSAFAVRKELGAPPAGVTELKFRDVYKLPVGPKGLQPTEKLLSLDGKRVRIVGYMVQQESAPKGAFLLSPLPVLLSDEDESLADDLPASAIRIDLPKTNDVAMPHLPGLLQFTGTLRVGMRTDAASGRATPAQIVLDASDQRALQRLAQSVAQNANAHGPKTH
jgi:hypothetical protein